MLQKSLIVSSITSLYFLPEIIGHFTRVDQFILAYLVQVLHDAICILFVWVGVRSLWDEGYLKCMNTMYSFVMLSFSFYKRCVLTLIYNYILNLSNCHRYIPIWQRVLNVLMYFPVKDQCASEVSNTYLWLNDHILQSLFMVLLNLNGFFIKKTLVGLFNYCKK